MVFWFQRMAYWQRKGPCHQSLSSTLLHYCFRGQSIYSTWHRSRPQCHQQVEAVSVCTHLFSQPTQKAHITRLLWATSEHSSDGFFLAMDCRFSFSATLVQLPSWGHLVPGLKSRTTQGWNRSQNGRKRGGCPNLHSLCGPWTSAEPRQDSFLIYRMGITLAPTSVF